MRVGVVQFLAGADKPANLARLRELIAKAAADGANLVVAPEASMHGFGGPATPLAPIAESVDGPFVTGLAEVAQSLGVTVVAGMFETVADDPERAYNTVVALAPDGALIGRYRKLHLFDALGWVESQRLVPGPVEPLTFDCGELTVGVLTCYDLRFPELARLLVDAGATLIAVPAAWVAGEHKRDQWATLVRARAIENTAYVAGAGQATPDYVGHSLVVDPFGITVAELGDDDGVAVVEVTAERVREVRLRVPSLEHRRLRVQPTV